MIIWRGALPRTGGTVCMNIAEYMLQLNGVDYKPVTIDDIFSNSKFTLPPERYSETLIGGWEGFYSESLAREPFHIIFVTRDIRDAFASFLKLTRLKFEDSLVSLEGWLQRNLQFLALPPERCLQLNYEEDIIELPNACSKIACFLGLEISEANIVDICAIFSKQAVGKHIDAETQRFFHAVDLLEINENDKYPIIVGSQGKTKSITIPKRMCAYSESGTQINGELPNYGSFQLIGNVDGTCRLTFNTVIENSKTDGFNQGHITNVSSWNAFFSVEQQELINCEILRVLKTMSFLPTNFIMNVLSNDDAFKSLGIFKSNPDLDLAMQHHTAGRLPQAESLYQNVLRTDPDQPVALHLLGVIALQVGKSDIAIELISKALAKKPDYVEAKQNLEVAQKRQG